MPSIRRLGLASTALAVVFAACSDAPAPTQPDRPSTVTAVSERVDLVTEMMALPRTVYGGLDQASGQLVFGVEDDETLRALETALERRGLTPDDYRLEVTEPIVQVASLRDRHRPTQGGLQIHFSGYLCTLGFSVEHSGGASFITNSHCTESQGSTGSTQYFQPLSSVDSDPIAIEADDPSYKRGGCSRGKKCRMSDASRALYQPGVEFSGDIARTTGANNGSVEVAGAFDITSQYDSGTGFVLGETLHKVGRTTGWTSGQVTASCVTVNVSGSNLQLLCQTIVENGGATIVGGGDSGSAVFRRDGASDAELVGILWGGSGDGSLFVLSPLASIEAELGSMNAVLSGTGTGGDGGDGGDGDGGDGGGKDKNCSPNSNAPHCR